MHKMLRSVDLDTLALPKLHLKKFHKNVTAIYRKPVEVYFCNQNSPTKILKRLQSNY